MVPMGGGRSGLVKLRSGCVGLTQAVGMVRLGISSGPGGSDCAVGIRGCCCCGAIEAAPSAAIAGKHTHIMQKQQPITGEDKLIM